MTTLEAAQQALAQSQLGRVFDDMQKPEYLRIMRVPIETGVLFTIINGQKKTNNYLLNLGGFKGQIDLFETQLKQLVNKGVTSIDCDTFLQTRTPVGGSGIIQVPKGFKVNSSNINRLRVVNLSTQTTSSVVGAAELFTQPVITYPLKDDTVVYVFDEAIKFAEQQKLAIPPVSTNNEAIKNDIVAQKDEIANKLIEKAIVVQKDPTKKYLMIGGGVLLFIAAIVIIKKL